MSGRDEGRASRDRASGLDRASGGCADDGRASGLDRATALRLCALTSEFYRTNAESFSQTRQSPWQGWDRVLSVAGCCGCGCASVPAASADDPAAGVPASANNFTSVPAGVSLPAGDPAACADGPAASVPVFRVFDLACGNLRFERYLASKLGVDHLSCTAVDNCDELACGAARKVLQEQGMPHVDFQNLDVIDALAAGNLSETLVVPRATCDLAVAFGFMHHVPLARWRVDLLRALVSRVRPGGFAAVSFWRFLNSDKLAKKAFAITEKACVEMGISSLPPNDFLLGWQNTSGLYRYCHHFDELEIERLMAAVSDVAQPVARFAADGKTGNLNEYVVLRVR